MNIGLAFGRKLEGVWSLQLQWEDDTSVVNVKPPIKWLQIMSWLLVKCNVLFSIPTGNESCNLLQWLIYYIKQLKCPTLMSLRFFREKCKK